jgi:hypothetical protein
MNAVLGMRARPPMPELADHKSVGFSREIWDIITQCWSHEPSERPDAPRILGELLRLPSISEASIVEPVAGHSSVLPARKQRKRVQFRTSVDNISTVSDVPSDSSDQDSSELGTTQDAVSYGQLENLLMTIATAQMEKQLDGEAIAEYIKQLDSVSISP